MERSKQQAIAFLLGAVLVGGALGFSADRVVPQRGQLTAGLQGAASTTPRHHRAQRAALDSILDDRNCRMDTSCADPADARLDQVRLARPDRPPSDARSARAHRGSAARTKRPATPPTASA